MRNDHGFTFVEMLIVLSAFIILSIPASFLWLPQETSLQKNLFFTQLKSDLLYAQQYAISHQDRVTVHIMPETHSYYIRSSKYTDNDLVHREYSSEIKIIEGSLRLYFHYMPDGNIDSFGLTYVMIGNRTYKMMVMIGKGRFYVTEE